jgi:GNAT superfamily N-acetyltransferase
MKDISIQVFNGQTNFEDLKFLISEFQAFVRTLEPEISVSLIHQFDLRAYLQFFYGSDTRTKIIYLAFVNNEVAGYISNYCLENNTITVYRHHKYAVLNEIFVLKKFRRNGVATQLIQSSIAWAKSQNCEYVQVGYAAHNNKAETLYNRRSGFKLSGKLSRFKL